MMYERIAVIPARGGSQRIPRKNIKEFYGKPIIAWSIEAAIESKLFDKIVVSTDDQEIAEVARNYGAETPFLRPESLADDFTGTNEVVKHAIQWFDNEIEYICCIYATAPFISPVFLEEGYEKLKESNKSFAFSVTTFPFAIQRALKIEKNGTIKAVENENMLKRSQDLEQTYHDAGQFYWGVSEAFLNDEDIFSGKSVPVILPRYLVQDIDTFEDWERAEIMFKVIKESGTKA